MRPRKYFWATMFVAVCDQNFGNSTPFWSKTALSLPGMKASRISHSTSSNGSRPGIVKKRSIPTLAAPSTTVFTTSSVAVVTADASVDAIDPPRIAALAPASPARRRGTNEGRTPAGRLARNP